MSNEKIVQILTKANQLKIFSYGSLGKSVITEDEFHSICSTLCKAKILKRNKNKSVYAVGGHGNSRQVTFDEPIEYELLVTDTECRSLIADYE